MHWMKWRQRALSLGLIFMIAPQFTFASETAVPEVIAKKYIDIWDLDANSDISDTKFTRRVLEADETLRAVELDLERGVRVEDYSEKYFWHYNGASALTGIIAHASLSAAFARSDGFRNAVDFALERQLVYVTDQPNGRLKNEPVNDQVRWELDFYLRQKEPGLNLAKLSPEDRHIKYKQAFHEVYAAELYPLRQKRWVTRGLYALGIATAIGSIYWGIKPFISDPREIVLTDEEQAVLVAFTQQARAKIEELKRSPKFIPQP